MKSEIREKIEEFWEWFASSEKWITEILNDDYHEDRKSLVQTMDNQILQFGMFTWEMGPKGDGQYFLTISPNGNEELLQVSKQIIALSPELKNWEFFYAKPAKDWDLKFSVFDDFMDEHPVDASGWRYLIQRPSKRNAQVIIEAENISHLDEETKMTAGDLVVTSLLGEAFKIYHIGKIIVVNQFDADEKSGSKSIFDLSKEFK